MNGNRLVRLGLVTLVALFTAVGASDAAAQSELDVAQADGFLGAWSMTLQTMDGDVPVTLNLRDANGKLAASLGGDAGTMDIPDVTRSGDNLVIRYMMDYDGTEIPVAITLAKAGENLRSNWDFADGAYAVSAVATKQ